MLEDKLTQVQRLRLEALAQANATRRFEETAEETLARAEKYVDFITKEDKDDN